MHEGLTHKQLQEVARRAILCHYETIFASVDDPSEIVFDFKGTFQELSRLYRNLKSWYIQKGITWNLIASLPNITDQDQMYLWGLCSRTEVLFSDPLFDDEPSRVFKEEIVFEILDKFVTKEFINYCLNNKSIALRKYAALFASKSAASIKAVLLLDDHKGIRNLAEKVANESSNKGSI